MFARLTWTLIYLFCCLGDLPASTSSRSQAPLLERTNLIFF